MFKKIMFFAAVILSFLLATPFSAPAAECSCGECGPRIKALESRVAELERRIAALTASPAANDSVWSRDTFNYLAIGNSLTRHGICKYWWNPVGMAASDADHDYFHLVIRGLEKRRGKVTARAFNFATWEITGHDRDQTFTAIDKLLDDRLSLVTIQLGENVKDRSTFAEDYVSLIEHIRQKTGGKAQIIVIGDFWTDDPVRAEAAKKCGVDYAPLDEALQDPKYRSRIGAVVHDAEGNSHTVQHKGVAKHPGDEGMAFIADRVLEKVK
jgi:hypothetical protein